MNTEEKISPRIFRMARQLQFVGWVFLLIGSIVSISPIYVLFHPDATISVNGVPTNDFVTKLFVVAFAIMFPILGSFLAFTPKITMQKWLMRFDQVAKDWVIRETQHK